MARFLRAEDGEHFQLLGSSGGLVLLICLVVMSISVISMLLFSCADGIDQPNKRRGASRRHVLVHSATDGNVGGSGVYGGHGGSGGGYYGGGGCGGGGGG